jgi:5-methylcytosine-specific restriction protein A
MTFFDIDKDPQHVAKERQKARKLKQSGWWKNKLASGVCHYCGEKFRPQELTLDHVVPLARGGVSNKSNIVCACKDCNKNKEVATPVDLILEQLNKDKENK